MDTRPIASPAWQAAVSNALKEGGIQQIAYVPDAHRRIPRLGLQPF